MPRFLVALGLDRLSPTSAGRLGARRATQYRPRGGGHRYPTNNAATVQRFIRIVGPDGALMRDRRASLLLSCASFARHFAPLPV